MNLLNSLLSYENEDIKEDETNSLIDSHPEDFANELVPKWQRYPHQRLFGDIVFQAVNQAERDPEHIEHVIITATPQIGKSFFFGTPVPAWYLNRFPHRSIIYASHTYSLAEKFTWKTREFVQRNASRLSFALDASQKEKGLWYTDKGGFMLAAGKGTAIPGYPCNLGIVDDLYSSEEEAYSPRQLEKTEDWAETSLFTRGQSNTLWIIIMTRWNNNDLIGKLLNRMKEDQHAEKFRLYNFCALTESQEECNRDPLHRGVGESVCPDRFSAEFYRRRKASISLFHWNALYKGMPDSEQGQMFQNSWFQYFTQEDDWLLFHSPNKPEKRVNKWLCQFFQVTDSNMKDKAKNDHHVTMTLGVTPDNDLFVYDVYRDHIEGADTLRAIKQQRLKHMHGPKTYIQKNYIEDTQAGTIAIQQARKLEDGFLLSEIKAEKSKRTRAMPLQEMYLNFKVYHPSGSSILKVLEDEILSFTGDEGGQDDQVDCLAYGAIILLNRAEYGLHREGSMTTAKMNDRAKPEPKSYAPFVQGNRDQVKRFLGR